MSEPVDVHELESLLQDPRRVAVLGAHPERSRAAYYVPAYLHDQGWGVVPVNPTREHETLFGRPMLSTLAEAGEVDVVVVFRPSAALPDHLEALAAANAPVIWFQQGITHAGVAAELRRQGKRVVQDRCMLADHRRLFGRR